MVGITVVEAQTRDVKSIRHTDISKLSDSQIQQIAEEMSKRGYTIEQASQLARAQGASESQISELKKRIEKLRQQKPSSRRKLNSQMSDDVNEAQIYKTNSSTGNEIDADHVLLTAQDSLVFGFNLFYNSNLSFEPNVNMPAPENYVLGPGDEIVITVWGQSEMFYNQTISSNGSIDIPAVGPVFIGGQTLNVAKNSIVARLKSIYGSIGSGTSVSVNMGKLRTITVNVLGEVRTPGTYTVSGAASLFNVLYLSGGPNRDGSFRNIQLMRGGKLVASLDVYDFLLNYKSEVNVPLLDGDMIVVPAYQKRVAVGGAFKRNGYFEAKEGETADDIIRYAGGFKTTAMTGFLGVTRVAKYGKEQKTIENASSFLMMNGDSISVPEIDFERFDNMVSVDGGVFAPGDYEFHKGMRLSELIGMAGGLVENVFQHRGVIVRLKEDHTLQALNFSVEDLASGKYDTELVDRDLIHMTTIDESRDLQTLTIKGAVRKPGIFDYCDGMTVGDLILLAGGLTTDASLSNVEVVRRLPESVADTSSYAVGEGQYINITRDLDLSSAGNSYILKPYDVVTVRSYLSAEFKGTITISGEVRFPGDYEMVNKNENILSMIRRAGGLTEGAYVKGARLYRRVKLAEKEKLIKMQQAMAQSEDTTKALSMLDFDTYELVSIDLANIVSNPNSYLDLKVQDGDEIVVPGRFQTVRVSGQVLNPVSLTWSKKRSARRFINWAGGFSTRAKKSKTYVIYPDGHAESTGHFLFFKNYPSVEAGCEVVVPEKQSREGLNPLQLASLASTLTTVAVLLVSLFRNN